MRAAEQVGFFTGLGLIIVLVAAMALGRCLVVAFQPAGPGAASGVPADDASDLPPGQDAPAGTNSTGAP